MIVRVEIQQIALAHRRRCGYRRNTAELRRARPAMGLRVTDDITDPPWKKGEEPIAKARGSVSFVSDFNLPNALIVAN